MTKWRRKNNEKGESITKYSNMFKSYQMSSFFLLVYKVPFQPVLYSFAPHIQNTALSVNISFQKMFSSLKCYIWKNLIIFG